MVQGDKHTAGNVDELESLEEFDEIEEGPDDDLDDADLPIDLDADLDSGLESGLESDLGAVGLGGLAEVVEDGIVDTGEAHKGVDEVEDEDEEITVDDDEDDEEGEEALDVILARDTGLEEDLRLDDEPREGLSPADAPIGAGEFTCRSCFLVKRRPQLADGQKMICFDCV